MGETVAFPAQITTMLAGIEADDDLSDDIWSITCEAHAWPSTTMGFGGIGGRMITPGWIVTITRGRFVETWHASRTGYAKMKSRSPIT